jgi:hypothetical protein
MEKFYVKRLGHWGYLVEYKRRRELWF